MDYAGRKATGRRLFQRNPRLWNLLALRIANLPLEGIFVVPVDFLNGFLYLDSPLIGFDLRRFYWVLLGFTVGLRSFKQKWISFKYVFEKNVIFA